MQCNSPGKRVNPTDVYPPPPENMMGHGADKQPQPSHVTANPAAQESEDTPSLVINKKESCSYPFQKEDGSFCKATSEPEASRQGSSGPIARIKLAWELLKPDHSLPSGHWILVKFCITRPQRAKLCHLQLHHFNKTLCYSKLQSSVQIVSAQLVSTKGSISTNNFLQKPTDAVLCLTARRSKTCGLFLSKSWMALKQISEQLCLILPFQTLPWVLRHRLLIWQKVSHLFVTVHKTCLFLNCNSGSRQSYKDVTAGVEL